MYIRNTHDAIGNTISNTMKIIPAIDLYNGNVVRLYQGRKGQCKIYSTEPLKVAEKWIKEGAMLIHIVDLNASFDEGDNLEIIKKIVGLGVEVEAGGGIRTFDRAQDLIACGISRIIMGTKALDDCFLTALIELYSDKVAVSVDAFNGKVATHGWQMQTDIEYFDFIKGLTDKGVNCVIYTDISKDGTLKGPSIDHMKKLACFSDSRFILSGGVGNLNDLKLIKKELPFVYGIIVGKALYENKLSLKDAINQG